MGYTDYNKFLMFGDSITEYAFNQFPGDCTVPQFCLGAGLQQAYARKLQVVQRGFSGYTSRDGVPLCSSILKAEHDDVEESKKIKLAYVFFGTNDARKKGLSSDNRESIPLDKYVSNMKLIVEEFKSRNIPLIVVTPGLHSQELWDKVDPQDLVTGDYRDNETNKLYADAIKDAITDVPVVPLFDIMAEWMDANHSTDYADLLYDGIHLSGTGSRLLFDAIMQTIDAHFQHLSPQYLPLLFPSSKKLTDATFANIN